jgi:hypothetical protein
MNAATAIAKFYIDTPSISNKTRERLKALCHDPLIAKDQMKAHYKAYINRLVRSDMYNSMPKETTQMIPSEATSLHHSMPDAPTKTLSLVTTTLNQRVPWKPRMRAPMRTRVTVTKPRVGAVGGGDLSTCSWTCVAGGLASVSVLMALLPR